jgi:hypothetical protein
MKANPEKARIVEAVNVLNKFIGEFVTGVMVQGVRVSPSLTQGNRGPGEPSYD